MISLQKMIAREKANGYSEANASAKVCQDVVLKALASGSLNRNVTIKGGVVMRSKSHNIRRATQDLDIDFIRYSLSDDSIDIFVKKLNCLNGINITRTGKIEALKQQDYHGKRIHILITDSEGYSVKSKIDLGVHNKFEIEQEEYCFDIALNDEGASLLINSDEQMFTEKLRSLLKFGPLSTRYKDVFDMYFLAGSIDNTKLLLCLDSYIFNDTGMKEKDMDAIIKRITMTFKDVSYRKGLMSSDKKWMEVELDDILSGLLEFLRKTNSES